MKTELITNQNLKSIDWSYADRQAMLKAVSRQFGGKRTVKAAPAVWMADVSAMDTRSVKAQLSGRRSLRAVWWNAFCAVHRKLSRDGSMAKAMYDFHRMHHAITLFFAELTYDYRQFAATARAEGLVKAVKKNVDASLAELRKPISK